MTRYTDALLTVPVAARHARCRRSATRAPGCDSGA
jgi:hypothetical protein